MSLKIVHGKLDVLRTREIKARLEGHMKCHRTYCVAFSCCFTRIEAPVCYLSCLQVLCGSLGHLMEDCVVLYTCFYTTQSYPQLLLAVLGG